MLALLFIRIVEMKAIVSNQYQLDMLPLTNPMFMPICRHYATIRIQPLPAASA